jgi:glycosyltransferase involved in cell wall biosynthesis
MNPKKLFIFSIAYDPFIGGAEVAIAEICKRQDFQSVVFTPRYSKDAPKHEQKGNVEIVRIGALWMPVFVRKILYIFQSAFIAWRRKDECRLAWSMMANHCGFATFFFSTLANRPYILTLQEGDEFGQLLSRWYMRILAPLYSAIFQYAEHIQCISNYLAAIARDLGGHARVSVIPNGVDMEHFTPSAGKDRELLRDELGIPRDAKVVVTSSRLVPKNGVDRVIRALPLIPDVHFLVLGEGYAEGELHSLATHLGVADRVHFAGFIPHADLPRYHMAGDAFIRLSRSEGLGISFLEAMSQGLPVICTNVGGIVDFAKDGETAFIVADADEEAEVAHGINRGLGQQAKEVGEKGRVLIKQNYQWDPIARAMTVIFANAIPAATSKETTRVLLVSGIYPPDVGGPAIHAQAIAKHLATAEMRVAVVCFGEGGRSKESGVTVIRISRHGSRLARWFRFAHAVWTSSRHADAIYAFDLTTSGVSAAFLSRWRKIPLLLRIGGDPIWERVVEKGQRFIDIRGYYKHGYQHADKPLLFRMVRGVIKRASHISVDNSFMKDFYVQEFGAKRESVDVVPNPVSRATVPAPYTTDPFVFLYAGRFVSYKNIPLVLKAFASLITHIPHARLSLIGEGPDRQKIEEAINLYDLKSKVTIEDKMPREALLQRIAQAHVVIAPAISEFNPNAALEALAIGRPILISKGSGLSVTVPPEWEFDPFDERSVAQSMKRMAEGYAEAIRRHEQLTLEIPWETVLRQHERFINEALRHEH